MRPAKTEPRASTTASIHAALEADGVEFIARTAEGLAIDCEQSATADGAGGKRAVAACMYLQAYTSGEFVGSLEMTPGGPLPSRVS